MQDKYKILSLDGGGIRGLITARLIDRLNKVDKIAGWLNDVDLIAGTSAGGLIALALSAGKEPSSIRDLYLIKGDNIFEKNVVDKVIPNIISAKYSNENLKEELALLFGDKKLGDLNKKVAIPTFDLDAFYDFDKTKAGEERGWKPKIFHNFKGKRGEAENRYDGYSDTQYLVKDVALYTSSAPTYFPIADGYIDGGVFANNPSNIAISQAITRSNKDSDRANLEDISLLSIGSGVALKFKDEKHGNLGIAQWASPLIDILMEGVSGISDFQAKQLLDDRYHRVQIFFESSKEIDLDDVDKLKQLDDIAGNFDIEPAVKWIDKNWSD